MRVIFMGTPEFAVPSLDAIVEAGFEVPVVVTLPDRPHGRGRKLKPTAVRRRAEELRLAVMTPESLKDIAFLKQIRDLAPDVICVVAFRILPPELYEIASLGSFNLHGSLLPKFRGAAPINRAIMAGEEETGVTTFFLKRRVDTGAIILQRSMPIGPEMTAGELHDEMMILGAEVVVDTLRLIDEGRAETRAQDDEAATPAPKICAGDLPIDWEMDALSIHNQIRGLSPRPGAVTWYDGERIKVFAARPTTVPDATVVSAPGEFRIESGQILVGTGQGALALLELQREGKRRMTAEEFVHGRSLPESGRFMPADPADDTD